MLDYDRLSRPDSDVDLTVLAICEFSRFVDAHERLAAALERIAPTTEDLQPAPASSEPPPCPCPPELRVKCDAVMGEPVSYKCGLCHKPAIQQPVGA